MKLAGIYVIRLLVSMHCYHQQKTVQALQVYLETGRCGLAALYLQNAIQHKENIPDYIYDGVRYLWA